MSAFASANKIPLTEMLGIFEGLRGVPPGDWKSSEDLTPEAREFAAGLPLYWIDGSEPPFLILHGDADDIVPPAESQAFADILEEQGVTAEFQPVPGASHFSLTLTSPSFAQISTAVEGFIGKP